MAHILIIEDEPNLQLLYREEFKSWGYHVVCFDDGRKAFDWLLFHEPDLVILDLAMPQGDGLEFLSKVVSEHMQVPVIINSAYSHYKNEFITWAAEAYIVKSSDLSELRHAVERVLAGRMALS